MEKSQESATRVSSTALNSRTNICWTCQDGPGESRRPADLAPGFGSRCEKLNLLLPCVFIPTDSSLCTLQVYQVVCKIVDDQAEKDQLRLTVPAMYDVIKRSNSSLNRRPKRLLEDSLERVVELVKHDVFGDEEEDSVVGDFEGLEEQPPQVPQVRGRYI